MTLEGSFPDRRERLFGREADVADYIVVIEMADAPAEQKAKALYNRGLARGWTGETAAAIADLTAVIEMSHAPAGDKAKACANLGHIRQEQGDRAEARRLYEQALALGQLPDGGERVRKLLEELDRDEPGSA